MNPLLRSTFAVVALSGSASAAISVTNSLFANSGSGTASPNISANFSVSASANYLVVAVAGEFAGDSAISGITYNGVGLSALGTASSGSSGSQQKVFFYGLATPSAGTGLSLAINTSNFGVTNGGFDYAVWALSNVDTGTGPAFAATGSASGSASASQTLALNAGSFVIAGYTHNQTTAPAFTGSLTSLPGGSTAALASLGTGIATGNQAAPLGAGSFTADLAGNYELTYAHGTATNSRQALGTLVFAPIPEPSAALTAAASLLVAGLRRRRA